jgi:hypothetical protein
MHPHHAYSIAYMQKGVAQPQTAFLGSLLGGRPAFGENVATQISAPYGGDRPRNQVFRPPAGLPVVHSHLLDKIGRHAIWPSGEAGSAGRKPRVAATRRLIASHPGLPRSGLTVDPPSRHIRRLFGENPAKKILAKSFRNQPALLADMAAGNRYREEWFSNLGDRRHRLTPAL